MKLSFSLNAKKPNNSPAIGATKPPPKFGAFNDDNDDDQQDAPLVKEASKARGDVNRLLAAKSAAAAQTKAEKKRLAAELKVDKTVFQYDEVYDAMKTSEIKAKARKDEEAKSTKPKYIDGLLATAETRRLDRLRAEEKLMQREREEEGDEFADKETFVTPAYKAQLEATRKAEAEEKAREAAMRSKGPTSGGMAHFYKQLLDQNEEVHSAAVAATSSDSKPEASSSSSSNVPGRLTGPSLTISKPPVGPTPMPMTDLELARLAREEGKDVELNDDNQIVDKRELLSAGLNLSLPNTRHLELQARGGKKGGDEPVQTHRAVGVAASKREIDERRRREVDAQWSEERERVLAEKKRLEEEERQRLIKRRNDDSAVESARERYLARKRQKLGDGSAKPGEEQAL
ncbi:hypothetical protein EXIGLDRAFT_617184 [Exidia glandulosa HHB12029]|uniref:Nuclear speckle splicing regulatory protein 1 N-terminal domain-containing protein n=1 Tax=Exidia glandulosa HHB12029 TaxID=1314781 RepID=A0A165GAV3_EXIGL|nr:hypothetical protein EXIGLDRAFT_617184 [Exidia glandulosa HHB12029]